jgi:hypothetical protein
MTFVNLIITYTWQSSYRKLEKASQKPSYRQPTLTLDNANATTTEWGEVHEASLKECDLSQKEHKTNGNECDLLQKNLDIANTVRSENLRTVTRKQ